MEIKRNWGIAWVIAFLGFPLGGLLMSILIGAIESVPEGIIGGAVAGLIIGGAQFLALRRRLPINAAWIGATAIGLAAGFGLSVAVFGAANTLNEILMRAALTGFALGVAQWWVLRKHIRWAVLWVPAVMIVYTLAWFITAQVIQESVSNGFVVFGASGAVMFQAVLGLALMFMLRLRPTEDAILIRSH